MSTTSDQAADNEAEVFFGQPLPEHAAAQATALKLTQCDVCGEFRGSTISTEDGPIAVSCLCDGIVCRRCQLRPIHRPISNYYNESDGRIIHVPYFKTMCSACIKKHNAQT